MKRLQLPGLVKELIINNLPASKAVRLAVAVHTKFFNSASLLFANENSISLFNSFIIGLQNVSGFVKFSIGIFLPKTIWIHEWIVFTSSIERHRDVKINRPCSARYCFQSSQSVSSAFEKRFAQRNRSLSVIKLCLPFLYFRLILNWL